MKKIILLLSCLFTFLASQGQTRFIPSPGQSTCTGSNLPYTYTSLTEVITYDTVSPVPSSYLTLYLLNHAGADTLVDSVCFNPSVSGSQSFIGDQITLGVKSGTRTTTKVKWSANIVMPSGATSVPLNSASKSWWFTFIFNGSKWILQYYTAY